MGHHVLYEESAAARAQCVLQIFLVDLLCRLQPLLSFILYVLCIAWSLTYTIPLSLPSKLWMYSQANTASHIHDAVINPPSRERTKAHKMVEK